MKGQPIGALTKGHEPVNAVSRASLGNSTVAQRSAIPGSAATLQSALGNEALSRLLTVQRTPTYGLSQQTSQAGPSAAGAVPSQNAATTPNTPASLRSAIGTLDYYRKRYDDFVRRMPEFRAPEYYLGYGDRYVHIFTADLRPSLSARGQGWLDCTLRSLQTAIEDRRDANPTTFATLESNNSQFTEFAYGTHPDAYLSCGICALSIIDETKIAAEPRFKDTVLSLRGLKQILDVFMQCNVEWFTPTGPTSAAGGGNVGGASGSW